MQVRTFDSIISTLRGGDSFTEALGLGPVGLVVIETDGSYEQVDSLKVASDGAPNIGKNVHDHAIDEVFGHPRHPCRGSRGSQDSARPAANVP